MVVQSSYCSRISKTGVSTPEFWAKSIITARKRSLGQGNIFTPVCHSVHRREGACMVAGGACLVALWGCLWLLGGVHGCSRGHAWLLCGGVCGCWGVCMVAPGGLHSCSGVGACMVAPGGGTCGCSGGHVWLLRGACVVAQGACMVARGGACVVAPGGCCAVPFSIFQTDE